MTIEFINSQSMKRFLSIYSLTHRLKPCKVFTAVSRWESIIHLRRCVKRWLEYANLWYFDCLTNTIRVCETGNKPNCFQMLFKKGGGGGVLMTLYSQKPVLEKEVLIIAQYFGSFVPNISRMIWLKLCNRIFKSLLNFQSKKKNIVSYY